MDAVKETTWAVTEPGVVALDGGFYVDPAQLEAAGFRPGDRIAVTVTTGEVRLIRKGRVSP